jgi:hypothetical protein
MNSVSAQDEFAKWAKLRRNHDKAVADYEKSSMSKDWIEEQETKFQPADKEPQTASSVTTTKATFDKVANGLRWLGTNGMRYLLQFCFSRQALFWLPQGWVPGYVEWLLSFPRAPKGSISIARQSLHCMCWLQSDQSFVVSIENLKYLLRQPLRTRPLLIEKEHLIQNILHQEATSDYT